MRRILIAALLLATIGLVAFANTRSEASEELAPGDGAPSFSLVNATDGKPVAFVPQDGKLKVVVFTCNQCPYAKAFEDRIVSLGREYGAKGVAFYAVNPNDDEKYDVERLEVMRERALAKKYPFPYLKDGDSKVAASYGARVTPHAFLVDGAGKIIYRGFVDDSAKPEERTQTSLADAIDLALAKKVVSVSATKAFGCSIKWKKG